MNNFKKIMWSAGVILCYTSSAIAMTSTSVDDYAGYDDSSDYETRISDLESAVTTLQSQFTTLQKQLQAAKVIPAAPSTGIYSSGTGTTNSTTTTGYNSSNYNTSSSATNYTPTTYGTSTSPYGTTNYDATSKYSSSSTPYGPTNYGASSPYNKNGTKKNTAILPNSKTSTTPDPIAVLEQKNLALKTDITNRQAKLSDLRHSQNMNPESLARKIRVNEQAIIKDKDQIAANNLQISGLQSSTQSRSPVLGSLSSTSVKKKSTKKIRNRVL